MIKRVSLKNFMSFDDIDLDITDKGGRCMNHAFIYGENGSGKTNLIDSFMFLGKSSMTVTYEQSEEAEKEVIKKLLEILRTNDSSVNIRDTPRDITDLARQYRMVDAEGNMVLRFQINIDGHDATYNLEFDEQNKIQSESLDYIVRKRRGNLFKITHDAVSLQKDLFSSSYRKEINDLLDRYWGKHTFIAILMHESRVKNDKYFNSEVSENIRSFLRYIKSMVVVKRGETFAPHRRQICLPFGTILSKDAGDLDRMQIILSKFFSRLYSDIKSVYFTKEDIGDGKIRYELYFNKKIAGKIRAIPAFRESSGTMHLMTILPLLIFCVDGKTVIMDEIDAGIHDLLMSQLISQCIPDITGQLIATTHDTSLMTYKDAPNIFIISIDRDGFKQIASIQSTEPPNIKTNIQKRYIEGYYSGIPLTADIGLRDIFESSLKKDSR